MGAVSGLNTNPALKRCTQSGSSCKERPKKVPATTSMALPKKPPVSSPHTKSGQAQINAQPHQLPQRPLRIPFFRTKAATAVRNQPIGHIRKHKAEKKM